MTCSKCGTENREGAKFCRGCGAALGLACPRCGAPHEGGQAFCDECGAALDESTPGSDPGPVPAVSPQQPAYLDAQVARFRARLDDAEADARYSSAARLFREVGTPFWLAVTLLEHGEWLAGSVRPGESEPLLAEAREIFERLGVGPWLERLDSSGEPEVVAAG